MAELIKMLAKYPKTYYDQRIATLVNTVGVGAAFGQQELNFFDASTGTGLLTTNIRKQGEMNEDFFVVDYSLNFSFQNLLWHKTMAGAATMPNPFLADCDILSLPWGLELREKITRCIYEHSVSNVKIDNTDYVQVRNTSAIPGTAHNDNGAYKAAEGGYIPSLPLVIGAGKSFEWKVLFDTVNLNAAITQAIIAAADSNAPGAGGLGVGIRGSANYTVFTLSANILAQIVIRGYAQRRAIQADIPTM